MSELLFLQALRDVGADESKWRDSRYAVYYVAASVSDDIEVNAFVDGAVAIETDTDGIQVRESDGNPVEAVRFAESLRRVLSGEPPLEVGK